MAAGLYFGLIVGFIAGLITFIPYVGALVGGILAIGLALFQFWGTVEIVDGETISYTTNWLRIGIVAAIFGLGQLLEGNNGNQSQSNGVCRSCCCECEWSNRSGFGGAGGRLDRNCHNW